MKKWSWLIAPAMVMALAAIPAHAQGGKTTTDKIWVIGSGGAAAQATVSMKYSDTFSAGWQSTRISFPWAHAQCWTADASGARQSTPFWDQWRALQADSTIGVFQLLSADPSATWPRDGGVCNVSLVSFQGNKATVTATSTDFGVGP
jgi:hypothetical protein